MSQTVSEFQTKAANALAKLAKDSGVTDSRLARDLSSAGIAAKVTDPTNYTVEVTVADDHGMPLGFTRSDFSAEKLAEIDAASLNSAKRHVWSLIKSRTEGAYITVDAAIAALTELGFGDASMPTQQTEVTFYSRNGQRDRYGDMREEWHQITLPGEVAKADVREMLAPHVKASPASELIKTVFPDAVSSSASEPYELETLSVNTRSNWPYHCEFDN